MRDLGRLASRLYNTPLLLVPEKADAIEAVFRSALEQRYEKQEPKAEAALDLMLASTMFTRTRAGYMRSDNGIALIQVLGPLVQRGAGIDAISGGFESYENVSRQLRGALADVMVRGILLEFDSPGGEANGVAALAGDIRAATAEKPVVAHANEAAFSAAYWLASSAEELYVPSTGMVGSVGVVMLHVDQSRMNEKRGLEVTHIFAGDQKVEFSSHAPLSDEARGRAQAIVDRLYGKFVDAVAEGRGISADAVRATQAGILDPEQATAAGMVDGEATLEQSLSRLTELMRDPTKRKSYGRAAVPAQLSKEHDDMTEKVTPAAATAQPAANTEARVEAAQAADLDAAKAAGTSAERARISGIMQHAEAEGRRTLAEHLAYNTSMSVEDSAKLLAASAKEVAPVAPAPANALDERMRALGNPKAGADNEPAAGGVVPTINTAGIYESRAKQRLAIVKA